MKFNYLRLPIPKGLRKSVLLPPGIRYENKCSRQDTKTCFLDLLIKLLFNGLNSIVLSYPSVFEYVVVMACNIFLVLRFSDLRLYISKFRIFNGGFFTANASVVIDSFGLNWYLVHCYISP